MYGARVWIAAFGLVILLTGCWNRTELNELGITTATGFDKEDGVWKVTYQIVVPSAISSGAGASSNSGVNQSAVHVFSSQGKTMREAVDLNNLENPRRLFFAHNNVVVLGKQAAEAGIDELIDLYLRNPDARETVQVIVTDGKARDIMQKFVPPERLPGSAIANILLKEKRLSSILPPVTIYDIALKLNSEAKAVGIPEIAVSGEDSDKLNTIDIYKRTSVPAKLRLNRLAVFKGDRMVGWIKQNDSLGLSWLMDKVKSVTYTIPCGSAGKQGEFFSYRVTSAKTKITPRKEGDGYVFGVKIRAGGDLLESTCPEDFKNPEVLKRLEHNIEAEIQKDVNNAWKTVQKYKADLPGFADKLHRKYPGEWKALNKRWDQELDDVKLDVSVKATIRRPGMFQKSFKALQKREEKQESPMKKGE